MSMSNSDFPELYNAADEVSNSNQTLYYLGIGSYLLVLIVAAFLSIFSSENPNQVYNIISALLFLISLSIVIVLKFNKPDDVWYNGRAVAESIKTRTWRWIMKAQPYISMDDEYDRKEFVKDLKAIIKDNKVLVRHLSVSNFSDKVVTDKMRNVRNLSIHERLDYYKQNRINDQAVWYHTKAKYNKRMSNVWFVTTIIIHALAILFLLFNIMNANLKLPVELIATIASAALTWSQSKKYNELSYSYTLTLHEIILLKSEALSLNTEQELSHYILNCENAFSREHTQWIAKKSE